jgi:excisionase family DNA binding protein
MTLLTIKDAADHLQMSEGFVKKAIRNGELAVVRFGSRCVRIRPEDLDRYVKAKIEGASQSRDGLPADLKATPFQEKSVSYRP